MSRPRIFPDVTQVSRGERRKLFSHGLITEADTPIPWVRLSGRMGGITKKQAKQLILLELGRGHGAIREDLIHRLVVKVTKKHREEITEKINKYLT